MSSYKGLFYFNVEDTKTGNLVTELSFKKYCKCASTMNVILPQPVSFNFDGVLLSPGERVLLKDQTNLVTNGIYVRVNNELVRANDFNQGEKIKLSVVLVEKGNTWKNTMWLLYIENTGIIDVDDISVVFFASAKDMIFSSNFQRSGLSNREIDLSFTGVVPGTYSAVQVDEYGRVIYGGSSSGLNINSLVFNEIKNCDGSTQVFNTNFNYEPNTLRVYLNGQRLIKDIDYNETNANTFTLLFSAPGNTEKLVLDYIKEII